MSGADRSASSKNSGVEWLGEIPTDWDVKPIKALADLLGGGTPDSADERFWADDTGTPWISIGDMNSLDATMSTQRRISSLGLSAARLTVAAPPVVLLAMYASVGVCAFLPGPAVWNQAIVGLAAKTVAHPRFLYWSVTSMKPALPFFYRSNTQDNLNAKQVADFRLAVPPLDQQTLIAAFLDRETAEIDAFIADQAELIGLLAERRAATISHAVTKGLDPNVEMKDSGVEWLGEVPAHWTVRAIRTISPVKRGASPRPIDDPVYFDDHGNWAWVRIQDVSASQGRLFETTQRLSDLGASLSVKLSPGALFLSIAGSVGKPCVAGIPCCIHDGFVYFPKLDELLGRFLFRVFESGQPFGGLGKMGTQLNLNTDTVGGVSVAVPSRGEMEDILVALTLSLGELDSAIADAREAISLSRERRAALISAAVTGKIDVREHGAVA